MSPRQLAPTAMHNTERYANNKVEADHGRLKARLRPMRGGHYDIATDEPAHRRLPAAFEELALAT